MKLSDALSSWTDSDQAAYQLGVVLGAITPDVPFSKSKRIFWENDPVGHGLHTSLLALVDAGLLEIQNEDEFRWAQKDYANVFKEPRH
ncbi:hypothetical protein [Streptomyces xanthophaeus]|uniref:hypothetical protein n=1 Tax=Streptomyces xanthophaeus TaxID=67385 RepID=UPI0036B7E77D